MKLIWIVGNGVVIVGAILCMAFIYHVRRSMAGRRPFPVLSLVLFGVTALITGLQFLYPEVLAAFRRDPDALREGEVWRMVTPLFVQPQGLIQCFSNAMFLTVFVPLAEKLYGRGMLALYFVTGVTAQIANYIWDPHGGGSSTACFGVIGGLFVYAQRNRTRLPVWLGLIPVAGLVSGVVLAAAHDGHGAGLLIGAVVALFLRAEELPRTPPRDVEVAA